jgi:hypothetical protein
MATEPDNAASPIAPVITRPRALTREEAREVRPPLLALSHCIRNMVLTLLPQKAQILRLRLGLASYKVRTGQTSVPLADLQMKPLPPRAAPRRNTLMGQQVRLPPPAEKPAEASPEKPVLPDLPSSSPRAKDAELPDTQGSISPSSASTDRTTAAEEEI